MTQSDLDAVRILGLKADELMKDEKHHDMLHYYAYQTLTAAIRHLAYPDRDVYPKTRRGTKGAPIVRR